MCSCFTIFPVKGCAFSMIRQEDLSYLFIKKEPQNGSDSGMRFYLTIENGCIAAYAYPDKFCFVKTPEENKIRCEFPNSPDSMPLIVEWLNEQHKHFA